MCIRHIRISRAAWKHEFECAGPGAKWQEWGWFADSLLLGQPSASRHPPIGALGADNGPRGFGRREGESCLPKSSKSDSYWRVHGVSSQRVMLIVGARMPSLWVTVSYLASTRAPRRIELRYSHRRCRETSTGETDKCRRTRTVRGYRRQTVRPFSACAEEAALGPVMRRFSPQASKMHTGI